RSQVRARANHRRPRRATHAERRTHARHLDAPQAARRPGRRHLGADGRAGSARGRPDGRHGARRHRSELSRRRSRAWPSRLVRSSPHRMVFAHARWRHRRRIPPMKFSIFFEMQIADPTAAKEAQTFHDCVEQSVLADELGYHCVWEVEHHGLYEYSHSSAPEIFLSFVAAKTKRIRIGHGVTLLPFRYNHPIRIAERVATLDILSGGRVNWGSGKSSSLVEQVAFENEIPKLHDQWLEAVEMIPRMWAADVFEHKGKFFQVAPIQIVPKPIQKPHPPMFAACSNPDSAAYVRRLG